MSGQHSSSSVEHAHSMIELNESGQSLEHLAGGGHSTQLLTDLSSGQNQGQAMDAIAPSSGRRHLIPLDRIHALSDRGHQSIRLVSGVDRDLINQSISSLGINQVNQLRNLTQIGRGSPNGANMATHMLVDGRIILGHGNQVIISGNNLQDSRNINSPNINFSHEQMSHSPLDGASIGASQGRPLSMGGTQHNMGIEQHQHGAQNLPGHLRGMSEHSPHSRSSLNQQQSNLTGDAASSNHNLGEQGRMTIYSLDNNGHPHSRPSSALLSETNHQNDAHDLTRSVYNHSSGQQTSSSQIEETISTVASSGLGNQESRAPGRPLAANSMLSLSNLDLTRQGTMGHGGEDESLMDLVGRHGTHNIQVLSERAGQAALAGVMDENSSSQSPSHSQGREVDKIHPCLTCLKLFRSKQQLAQHSLVHSGVRKHVCSFCDRAFKQLSHLQQHVRIHTGERKYLCKFCERGFKQMSHLQKHTRIHTGERKFVCSICEKAFKELSHLQQHFRIHTGERKYVCQLCSRAFKQMTHLQQHHRIHTGERKYVCQICNRAFKQMTHLQQHHIIHTGERKYVCQICNKAFKQMTHLQQHHRIHTGERKYVCQVCSRAFKQLTHLQKHHVIHTGERKYVCQVCSRAFKQLTHLQKHHTVHTGEKPYRCKFENCERAFAQLSNLQHHMRNHDDQVKKEATRIHKCQICHRCYTNENSLKAHTLKMHIHIKPVDQHDMPPVKKKKRKNKNLFAGAPSMVPVSSAAMGNFSGNETAADAQQHEEDQKPNDTQAQSPTTSEDDDDEIIFVAEQAGHGRMDNFGSLAGGLGMQGQILQGAGDVGHQIPFTSMGNFSRGADPLALLASANRFTLQDNMMAGFGSSLNSFTEQLSFRDAALLNSRFGDLRAGAQGFDERFASSNLNQHGDAIGRNGNNNPGAGGSEGVENAHAQGGANPGNQIPMAHGGLGSLLKHIKQEPLEYFSDGNQLTAVSVANARGFLSPQHLISTHLRGQLPSLNVPLIREHFPQNHMLPSSLSSTTSVAVSAPIILSSIAPSSTGSQPGATLASFVTVPLPVTSMSLYSQPHFTTTQRVSGPGPHGSPVPTSSGQMGVTHLVTQGSQDG